MLSAHFPLTSPWAPHRVSSDKLCFKILRSMAGTSTPHPLHFSVHQRRTDVTFVTCKASELHHCKRLFCLFSPCRATWARHELPIPLGHVCTNPAVVFPLICAEVVEKLTNQIFPVQPVKLGRWSLTISSEGRKPLNALYMRFPPLCQLKRQNEDALHTD